MTITSKPRLKASLNDVSPRIEVSNPQNITSTGTSNKQEINLLADFLNGVQTKLEPYSGSGKKVVVYNTYADKGRLHFDVFIPTDKSQASQVAKDIDSKAVEYAKEFLNLIGKPSDDIAVNMCERCHIDNTDLYAHELWKLPGKEIFVWPMEGCPKPS